MAEHLATNAETLDDSAKVVASAPAALLHEHDKKRRFATDSEIGVKGRGAQKEHKLVAVDSTWLDAPTKELKQSARGWDQFAEKEAKTGNKSTYSYDLYTTTLDPSKRVTARLDFSQQAPCSDFWLRLTLTICASLSRVAAVTPEQMAEAERLANEIVHQKTTNKHMLEERGLKDLEEEGGDEDEEAKYSMVLRKAADDTCAALNSPVRARGAVGAARLPL